MTTYTVQKYQVCNRKRKKKLSLISLLTTILVSICGIKFKKKPHYSIISLWLHPPQERKEFNRLDISILMDAIKENIYPFLQPILHSSVIVDNKTGLFSDVY